ncbi:DUF4267 domain-containing protein [Kitasatospora sp. NPDC051853]|uniref:DUF4267 domain-containing protein n=1 Tax=Kitasatospora sp. NPDC051853 TaxID=3364058 RepID=UPI0037B3BB49
MKKHLATVLVLLGAGFVLWFGTGFVLGSQTMASGFGLPDWPTDQGTGFLVVKGIRDVALALVLLALLLTGQRRALGWVMLVTTTIPVGDMSLILARHGDTTTALTVHGLTALVVLLTAVLLLTERRPVTTPARQRS